MMPLRVPYVAQRFDFTCGPAAVRMVLGYFGITVGPLRAWWYTRVRRTTGTSRRNLMRAFRAAGLHVHAHHSSSVAELRSFVERGVPVVVNYREPDNDEGHYAVVIGVSKKHILLRDPYHGPRFALEIPIFRRRWLGSRPRHQRWMLAAMRHPLPLPPTCPQRVLV